MIPVLVQLGPVSLYSFGAMLALGFLVGGTVLGNGLAARGIDRAHASPIVFWAAVSGIVGSRILAALNQWSAFVADPLSYVLTGAGFVWYGGLAGGFIGVTVYLRRAGLPWLVVGDALMPGLVLGQAIGRVGCQLSGDGDWGVVTDLPWAMAYPEAIFGWEHAPGVRVHPAPVYESLLYCGIYFALAALFQRRERFGDGSVLFGYLALTGVARFLVEAIRIEPVVLMGLTEAQWFGIFSVVAGGAGMAWAAGRSPMRMAAVSLLMLVQACTAGSKMAPDFVAEDLSGQAVRLSAHRGKVVFLNLWATWCGPCREEMPSMEALSRRLADEDFIMLAVSEDDGGAGVVEPFVRELGLTFPILVDPTGAVGQRFGVFGYPETFIIDREGRQVARFIGPRNWRDPAIEKDLRTLIDEGRWVRGPDGNTY